MAVKKTESQYAKTDIKDFEPLSLEQTLGIINAVMQTVFSEDGGFIPEYLEIAKAYFKILYFCPSFGVDKISLSGFYDKYCAGEYDNALLRISQTRQSEYIDNAVEMKINFKIKRDPALSAAAELLNHLSKAAKKFADDVSRDDFKQVIADFKNFTEKADGEAITEAVLNKHLSAFKSQRSGTNGRSKKVR